ncbi:hypothetical protein CF392_02790 [Tamilnaduibacter salinus]|uniref:ATPase AAA-type core domain-containing protein n=1 Tax=Tamilnaduibacter salinus TaxID=1484056 RepID=A0A2A2I5Z7_9GAMM|nr:AAA family ATPase [Tamilnaduibacter salinus]PAV27077.1 hypothetical protein CF392_02790 [Tamilnaduibacter salinus]
MIFKIIPHNHPLPSEGRNTAYLKPDDWNDYHYQTMFHLAIYDGSSNFIEIGSVKIGFKGQTPTTPTRDVMITPLKSLEPSFFSMGAEADYYKQLAKLPQKYRQKILTSLRDVVFDRDILKTALDEDVFNTSLMRFSSLTAIKFDYSRILDGSEPLTDFKFTYQRTRTPEKGPIELRFEVGKNDLPSTNIHALIGRNGSGKTTLLNDMTQAITHKNNNQSRFIDNDFLDEPISDDYFGHLVSVSFSAFDPFPPPEDQPDVKKGTCYKYIGLKDQKREDRLKNIKELQKEALEALEECLRNSGKRARWSSAINGLETDINFSEMNLKSLLETKPEEIEDRALDAMASMSSGHAIVFITITNLIAYVGLKTLVLIDEPESHLHPPLLSAFIRALSNLLKDQNGVAIIATHSPVVLQEVPRCCVWTITRFQQETNIRRPRTESFGKNVGTLTRDIFGLEVTTSGFHQLIKELAIEESTYKDALNRLDSNLGLEGRSILKTLMHEKEKYSK